MSNRVESLLKEAAQKLDSICERPLNEAQILLAEALGKDKLWLITHPDTVIEDFSLFWSMIERRSTHEPIEYITNKVSFFSQDFFIDKGALIPRPETELLIEKLLEKIPKDFKGHIVEVGVGSGIISIMLALHLPDAHISAIDISPDALKIARVNVEKFGLSSRIKLFEGDLLGPIEEKIDVLVSNPPYIKVGELLEKNLSYEPQNALFGGNVGDEILKRLIDEAVARKIPLVGCEMGYDQKQPIEDYVTMQGFYKSAFYRDYAGLDRGFILEKI